MKLVKKRLWASPIMILLASMTVVTMVPIANVASASPDTHFYVDPPLVDGTPAGSFLITIKVAEANDTYGWTISLSWDPDLLELVYIMEGDFLERGTYATSFVYDGLSLDDANLEGQIMVGCSLLGDVNKTEDWASGDGTLCNLGFIAQAEGSCDLDLFDTILYGYPLEWDEDKQAWYPTPTPYDNVDGFVTTTLFYNVDVSKWKIKVNGEVGGKTTVGTENLVEANVENIGNFTVDVQVSFEIRDFTGYRVANATSDIVPLPVGELTTLSFNWTADYVGIYNITAHAFYSAPPLVPGPHYPNLIPDGFTNGTVTVTEHDIAITNVTCSPTTVTIGDLVSINVTVVNEGGFNETFDVSTYYDSIPIEEQTDINLDAGATTTLTFKWNTTLASAGVYDITAEASEVPNEIDTTNNVFIDGNVTVISPPGYPFANFTYSPEEPLVNEEVTFNATDSYDEDGIIVSYEWDFDDGTTKIYVGDNLTAIATHTYTEFGNYMVKLTVTDNSTLKAYRSKPITVYPRAHAPPVANFTYSPEDPMSGDTVTFNATDSNDPDGDIVSYAWNFDDGTPIVELPPPDGVIVTHSYADDGTYTVTLNITDNDGLSNITSADITVLNRPPVAFFSESAETVNTGETITFNASDSYDPDGSIVSYFWDFGDGTNATETNPITTHQYTDDGNYTVTLTVTDDDGATNSVSATKTVKAPEGWSLVWYAVIGLGIAALALIAFYALYRRRKK